MSGMVHSHILTVCRAAARRWLWGIVMPEERTLWDIGILLSMLWVCFGSTTIICFDLGANWRRNEALAAIELAVDVLFAADIWINFRSSYYDHNGMLVGGHHTLPELVVLSLARVCLMNCRAHCCKFVVQKHA